MKEKEVTFEKFLEQTSRTVEVGIQSGSLVKKIELTGIRIEKVEINSGFIKIKPVTEFYNESLVRNVVDVINKELGMYTGLVQWIKENGEWYISIITGRQFSDFDLFTYNILTGKDKVKVPFWKRFINFFRFKGNKVKEGEVKPHYEYITVSYNQDNAGNLTLYFYKTTFKIKSSPSEKDRKNWLNQQSEEKDEEEVENKCKPSNS
jgi:hypothetical protein